MMSSSLQADTKLNTWSCKARITLAIGTMAVCWFCHYDGMVAILKLVPTLGSREPECSALSQFLILN